MPAQVMKPVLASRLRTIVACLSTLAVAGCGLAAAPQPAAPTFADEIARLSEPGGFFDTDNLMSNERTYLHALDALRDRDVSGGVYVGVGPDQNFSYIAQVQPTLAYIVDIRRDNLLTHLLFKTLFHLSPTRIEYLARLFGRPPPEEARAWEAADVGQLATYIDQAPVDEALIQTIRVEIDTELSRYGVPLSSSDRATVARFHRTFIKHGLSLRFHSLGRPPRPHYPTYRDLLVGTDRTGAPASYLATRSAYQIVRSLQTRGLIIPIVGDLAGDHAVTAIGATITARGERVSAFYTSNVEFYLFQRGLARQYLDNIASLPRDAQSVVIRSVFGRLGRPIARGGPSYSAPIVQPLEDLVEGFATGRYRSYLDLAQ